MTGSTLLLCLLQSPFVTILGTAQDGGFPQIACEEPPCRRARAAPLVASGGALEGLERLPSCLLLVDPRSGRRFLFEATPALPRQVALARDLNVLEAPGPGRPALFDGLFLTHAHMGHYTGLVHLGKEAWGGAALPLHATAPMLEFLQGNEPWKVLFTEERLSPRPLTPEVPVVLGPDLQVTALQVPHRDEFSDTVAFRIEGPERSVLFLPDIDKWERWDEASGRSGRLEEELARVDIALVDGTFFAEGEIPGRSMADIPHPFVEETLARLAALPAAARSKVHFLHLNHTNPLCLPDHPARTRVRDAGFRVAREGDRHDLGEK